MTLGRLDTPASPGRVKSRRTALKKQKGFSLIELLIVVAIILIIAAIAIPNLLRARISANEASAVGSLRTIVTGETSYQAAGWTTAAGAPVGYSAALGDLGDAAKSSCQPAPTVTNTCYIDNVLASATTAATAKSGYYFTYVATGGGPNTGFTVNGDPATRGQTGSRSFFVDQSGVIRANPSATAVSTDPAIQ